MAQSAFAARRATQRSSQQHNGIFSPANIAKLDADVDVQQAYQRPQSRPPKRRKLARPDRQLEDEIESVSTHTLNGELQGVTGHVDPESQLDQDGGQTIDKLNALQDVPGWDLPPGSLPSTSIGSIEPLNPVSNPLISWNTTCSAAEIKLRPGEAVLIAGEFELWIKKGSVRLLGATLHARSKLFRVHSPYTHAVPPIEALSNPFGALSQGIEIRISSCNSGVRSLQRCEPRYAGIWHDEDHPLASFEVVEERERNSISPLQIPPDWNPRTQEVLESRETPVVLICGPKNAGKSTYAKYLSNVLLSRRYTESGLAYLDLDPGQPEYSSSGDLTLSHIKTCNLGPSFVHPAWSKEQDNQTIRQHHYGYLSPRVDTTHYLTCAKDLYQHYSQEMKQDGVPLIVNTCGWMQGLGSDLLEALIKCIEPTHVLSFEMRELETPPKLQNPRHTRFSTLTTAAPSIVDRSPADLRTMQQCAYFHLQYTVAGNWHWAAESLFSSQPLSWSYAGENRIISGILLLGNRINSNLLESAIDRTVLALVAIDDTEMIYDKCAASEKDSSQCSTPYDEIDSNAEVVDEMATDSLHSFDTFVLEYNDRGLPFLSTINDINPPLDPTRTKSLGQVLLDGIDYKERVMRVHTPILPAKIQSCMAKGQRLILVRGQLGMPEWAYLEASNEAKARQKDTATLESLSIDVNEEDVIFDVPTWIRNTPYIEYQDMDASHKRGKVRRVRRNLGAK